MASRSTFPREDASAPRLPYGRRPRQTRSAEVVVHFRVAAESELEVETCTFDSTRS